LHGRNNHVFGGERGGKRRVRFYLWGGSLIPTLVLTVMMPIIALISYLVGR